MNRYIHIPATGAAALAIALAAVPAADAAIVPSSGKTIAVNKTAKQLGAPKKSSAARLAGVAAKRYAARLGASAKRPLTLKRRLPAVTLAGGGKLSSFEFEQRMAGREVMWSKVVVHVRGKKVAAISGTGVAPKGAVRKGAMSMTAARGIATRAVPNAEATSNARRVIWAGMPGDRGKRPVEAVLVQVDVNPLAGTIGWEGAAPRCVVVDEKTGKVLTIWEGSARNASTPAPPADAGDFDDGPAEAAQAGENRLIRVRDAKNRTDKDARAVKESLHSRTVRYTKPLPNPFNYDFKATFKTGSPFSNPDMNTLFGNAELLYSIFCSRSPRICSNGKGFWDVFGNTNLSNTQGFENLNVLGLHTGGSRKIHISPKALRDFDVLAHEMGHEYAQQMLGDTTNQGEAGAVNEAYGDIAAYLAGGNRTVFTNVQGVAPQSLDNPSARMGNYSPDCGKVHQNARILDRAFLLARDATSFEVMQETFRRAMSGGFIQPATGFRGFREGIVGFARVRFGGTTATKIEQAFDTVGVTKNVQVPACK